MTAPRPTEPRRRGGSSAALRLLETHPAAWPAAGLLFAGLLGLAAPAAAHDGRFTPAENAWLERQRANDGTKCCNEHDAHVGLRVRWRMAAGRYEVRIGDAWLPVPPGRIMRHDPADPSPFGAEALLFYSPTAAGPMLWCFSPEPLT